MRLLIISFLFICSLAPAQTYYISTSGSAGNNGTSSATPWNYTKLASEFGTLPDGSLILFKRGDVFTNFSLSRSYAITNLGISDYGSGEKPVLDGSVDISGGWTNEGNNLWSKTEASFPDMDNNMRVPVGLWINDVWSDIAKWPENGLAVVSSTVDSTSLTDNSQSFTLNEFAGSYLWVNHHPWYYSMSKIQSNNSNTFYIDRYDGNYGRGEVGRSGCAYLVSNCKRGLINNGDFTLMNDKLTVYFNGDMNSQTVRFVNNNNIITLNNSTNVGVTNIRFRRANMEHLEFNDGVNLNVSNCDFEYAGNLALQFERVNKATTNNNTILRTQTSGIFFRDVTRITAQYNRFKHIATNLGTENEDSGFPGFCITVATDPTADGDTNKIRYNVMDSVFGGINWYWNQDAMLIEKNFINSYGWNHGDYGGIYNSAVENNVNSLSKNNIVINAAPAQLINSGGAEDTYAHGLYIDGGNRHVIHDSLTVVGGNVGLKINDGNRNNILRNSLFYNMSRDMAQKSDNWQTILFSNTSSTYDNSYLNNTFILGPSNAGNTQRFFIYHNTPVSQLISDNNKYINPFPAITAAPFRKVNDYYASYFDYDLQQLKDTFNLDLNSSFNPQNHSYSAGLGISESDFVKVFINASDTSHVFNLGNCVFKDVDGNTVSGSATVKPFYHKALFYVSGTLSTIDNIIYSSFGTFSEPTTPVENPPAGMSLIKVGNSYKYINVPGYGKLVLGIKNTNAVTIKPKPTNPDPDPEPIDTTDFNILFHNDYEQWPAGPYTFDMQQADGGGALYEWGSDHRTDINDPQSNYVVNESGNNIFRVTMPAGTYGAASGTSFEYNIPQVTPITEAFLSYKYRLKSGFIEVLGGKMIGLMGGTVVVPYGRDYGFNAGAMWDENQGVTTYIYHAGAAGDWAESSYWSLNGGSFISDGEWHTITIRVVLGAPDAANGIFEAWIDGVLKFQSDHYKYRTSLAPNTKIDRLMFVCFFGGGSSDFETERDEHIDFDKLTVWKYNDSVTGVTRGLNLSNPNTVLTTPLD